MGFRGDVIRRNRAGFATLLALAMAATTMVVYAVSADGYQTHRADLNDGGIWVTSSVDGIFGRINKPINQADGAMFADPDDNLDVVQQGAVVAGVNLTDNLLTSIDPATVQPVEGEEANIAPGAEVGLGGASLAVLDPVDGRVWAQHVDPVVGRPGVTTLAEGAEPLATAGKQAALAVTVDGSVLVASAETDEVARLEPSGEQYAEPTRAGVPAELDSAPLISAVGSRAVVIDSDTGELMVIGGGSAALPPGSVLQQPGPKTDTVLVSTRTELLELDLETGGATSLAEGLSGRPTAAVRLGACVYAAWSGGRGLLVTKCGSQAPVINTLQSNASDLVFRVNRDEILLNDRLSGAVWNLDSDQPARIDDWDAFRSKNVKNDKDTDQNNEKDGDRQPPRAKPDDFGARPGRTTVLFPLDNDTAPKGRILAIRSLSAVSGPGEVSIGPDGQTVQLQLPAGAAGLTRFDYVVDDGRKNSSDSAAVAVRTRERPANGDPELRPGFRQRDWVVPATGILDLSVLADWRDPSDGDPLTLLSASAVDGQRSGAVARTTGAGQVRLMAPSEGGVVSVDYTVTDGAAEVTKQIEVTVQDKLDTSSVAPVAEPDIVSGEVGKPILIKPLGNDLAGSDPLTPGATLELAGKVAATGGADVKTDLVEGTITFSSETPRTFLLDYDAAYGSAPIASGRIRVDVAAPARPVPEPVAMPDQVTLFGQSPAQVDVLANDVDPSGGMLVVQLATPVADNQLDVAIVQGRWVRVAVRQGELTPNPQTVRYTISNGVASAEGEITVSQRPRVDDNTPVTRPDRVVVRSGAGITVPALDNDFSPAGDQLNLVGDGPAGSDAVAGRLAVVGPGGADTGDGSGGAAELGSAFVARRQVRFVAPEVAEATAAQVRYLAVNQAGQTAPGVVEITVIPEGRRNQAPEPPLLEARTVAGAAVKIRLPGVGVDPDGDPVTLIGLASAPTLGRIVKYGANSLEYQAYPGSAGTDEFTYRVVDSRGEPAVGTARVAVVAGGLPQPPLAVDDVMEVAPGAPAVVDVLANDLIADGDRVTIEVPDSAGQGVRLVSESGPLIVRAPSGKAGQTLEVAYRLTNGLETSQASLTLRTVKGYNNPPVVYDVFGTAEDSGRVSVDALESAYDPDGANDDLTVTDVYVPAGAPQATVDDGTITVGRGPQPAVVPFTVTDGDGGVATASLYVPARGENLPYARDGAVIELEPGQDIRVRLSDYIVNPAGGPVAITIPDRIGASPQGSLAAAAEGGGAVRVRAGRGYSGPGALVVEVTTARSGDDKSGVVATVSIPVQVGVDKPILSCPDGKILVPSGESVEIPVAARCHVWTIDPTAADSLSFDAEWSEQVDGLTMDPQGGVIVVSAAQDADVDTTAVLAVSADGSEPGLIRFEVTGGGPPPSLAAVQAPDMDAGESQVLDLAPYLRPGINPATPTVLEVSQVTNADASIEIVSSSLVRITTGPETSGSAQFRVVMSDVPRDRADPRRRVEGRISVDVRGLPGTPTAPVPGNSVVSEQVALNWQAPDANGAPIDYYEVRAVGGSTQRCASTTCQVSGLANGQTYRFQVRAHNAVGFSEWSGNSRTVTPDARPGLVGSIQEIRNADKTLVIGWREPQGVATVDYYVVAYDGIRRQTTSPQLIVTRLDNNKSYRFKVYAVNKIGTGPVRESQRLQSQGPIGLPAAPTIVDNPASETTATLTISWPAVSPNGPGPVAYRVLRNGENIPGCEGLATSCSVPGVAYDGRTSLFRVIANVPRDPGQTGPETSWDAVGRPDPWGAWTVEPTGQDNQARMNFTVPLSRGTSSNVSLIVDGAVVREYDARGAQTQIVTVANNDGPHSVALRVCNESNECADSASKQVQTYGSLLDEHLLSIRAEKDARRVRWVIEVNTNGDPAGIRVSSENRDQVISAPGIGRQTLATAWVDIGFERTERLEGALYDASPNRGEVRGNASVTTDPPPPPNISLSKQPCSDDPAAGLPECGGRGPTVCVEASCAFVLVTTAEMNRSWSCNVVSPGSNFRQGRTQNFGENGTVNTGFFYREGQVFVECNENNSPRLPSPTAQISFP